nr:DUF4870 domain-containing protein [Propionibacterium sp.]
MSQSGDDEPTEALGPVPPVAEHTEVMPAVDPWTPVPPPAPRHAAPAPPFPDFPPPAPDAVPVYPPPGPSRGFPVDADPWSAAPPASQPHYGWDQPADPAGQGAPSASVGWPGPAPGVGRPTFDPPSGQGWGPPAPSWGAPQPGLPAQGGWAPTPQGWPGQGWVPAQQAPSGWGSGGWAPTRPSQDDRTWAPAAHWLPLLTHWVGPLVVLLTAGRRSERVRAEAVSSLNWEITVAILLAVATALGPFGLVAPVLALVTVAVSVGLHVYGAIIVARGGRFRYPGALPFIA